MAKNIDEKAKQYMQRPEVFADVFNYFLYSGAHKLQPEQLRELDTTELALPYGSSKKMNGIQKYRDVLKHAVLMEDGRVAYQIILGIENQTQIHYAMPVKNMIYDALNYGKQVTAIAKSHKEQSANKETDVKPSKEEFLSGFHKDDCLLPVITLVIYLGQKTWDGALNLHSMFSKCDPALLQYVPDYKINLVSPVSMSMQEIAKFNSDFKELAIIINSAKNADAIKKNISENKRFEHLDKLTADLAFSLIDSRLKLKANTKGEVNVCKGIDQLIEQESHKRALENALRMLQLGKLTIEEIAMCSELSINEVIDLAKGKSA